MSWTRYLRVLRLRCLLRLLILRLCARGVLLLFLLILVLLGRALLVAVGLLRVVVLSRNRGQRVVLGILVLGSRHHNVGSRPGAYWARDKRAACRRGVAGQRSRLRKAGH